MDFKIGDYVEITHPGRHYFTYDAWLNKNVLSDFLRKRWIGRYSLVELQKLGIKYIEQGMRGTIMAIAPHEYGSDTLAYFLSDDCAGYIIGLNYDNGGRAAEKVN